MILHVDLNSFYASCAVIDSGGQYTFDTPLMVCGDPKKRHGIVLAATYPVKKLGVHAGMSLWQARQLCPQAVVAKPEYHQYMRYSEAFMAIISHYSPLIMRYGIDEAYIDYSGCEHIFGPPEQVAHAIRERVKRELGLTVSVGVGENLIRAKMGSDYRKPDAVTVLDDAAWRALIWPKVVEELQFVGRATGEKLRGMGIFTIGELAQTPERTLRHRFGVTGHELWLHANGLDTRRVTDAPAPQKEISHSITLPQDLVAEEEICRALLYQTERVATRLRKAGMRAGQVGVYVRYADLSGQGKQAALPYPSDLTEELYQNARPLILALRCGKPIRLVGVHVSRLTGEAEQATIFDGPRRDAQHALDRAVDAMRQKYGSHAVMRAGTLQFEYDEKEDFTPFKRH
ncbi:MAG: DNA polymerase IV [Christensenellaceae bacterium]|nr:DNA polymerase IV [Christensenellaceae bacterium]